VIHRECGSFSPKVRSVIPFNPDPQCGLIEAHPARSSRAKNYLSLEWPNHSTHKDKRLSSEWRKSKAQKQFYAGESEIALRAKSTAVEGLPIGLFQHPLINLALQPHSAPRAKRSGTRKLSFAHALINRGALQSDSVDDLRQSQQSDSLIIANWVVGRAIHEPCAFV
jgi:hypothetical protein